MRVGAIPFAVGAWAFLAGVIVQVFLAGMGLFELTDWTSHGALGWGLSLISLLLPLLAIVSGVRRRTIGVVVLLTFAAIVQPELALARHDNPVVAAFHPVNALLVFWLAWLVARASLRELRPTGAGAPATATPTTDEPSSEPAASPNASA